MFPGLNRLGAFSYLLWKWLLDGPLGGNESLYFQDLRYFLKLERLVGASIGSSQKNIGMGHYFMVGCDCVRTVRRPFGNVRRYGFGKRHRLKEPTLESDEKPETTKC
ncbi:hypothetical protein IGI04_042326 [Brassica rapa subsp. trilocularis]|uniref:Uncharacterized protein n=1 Tax=Brassica rapa subsp. trilocularis TaxID=1813537 RepID=A0ABQ7KMJ6_BRACM|nr:hypothetical protein IGI04_042326 [Brassica rapa subsp. trilocularis]